MKAGISLHEMATLLEATKASKADYVGGSERLYMTPEGKMEIEGVDETYAVTKHASRQMTEFAKIPAAYADRCPPDLLANNVNYWLREGNPKPRMARTMQPNPYLKIEEPTMRALVSDKYRVIDNYDVAQATLPVILKEAEKYHGIKVDSVNVTNDTFYLKAHLEGIEETIMREGHVIGKGHDTYYKVRPGIEIGNGEIGNRSFWVAPALWEDHCTNMAVFRKNGQKRYHIGTAQSDGELWKMLSDETQRVSNEALMMQMADYVRSALDVAGDVFKDTCNSLREKMEIPVIKPESTMKLVADRFSLTERESDGILNELLKVGDMNVYGIQAAVTLYSQNDELDYVRSSELEGIGGDIIDLDTSAWEEILAEAA